MHHRDNGWLSYDDLATRHDKSELAICESEGDFQVHLLDADFNTKLNLRSPLTMHLIYLR